MVWITLPRIHHISSSPPLFFFMCFCSSSVTTKRLKLRQHRDQTLPNHRAAAHLICVFVSAELHEEAGRPEKDTKTLSSDLIEYAQYMIREHGDDFKAMARDEKNYYQDTPKQIKRKINEYKRCHSQHYDAFISSLAAPKPTDQ
uniref:Nucleolar protein 16 n=1 Tax=Labrus bergylta TaxID=56723 RepID=A0A3Q3FEG0_9LABR